MTRRTKVLLAITVAVLLVMGVVLYLLWKNRQSPAGMVNKPGANVPVNTPNGATNAPPGTQATQTTPFAGAEATARSFAERFGSFSSESNFQNVADLYAVMTPTMHQWADTYVATERAARAKQTEFYGITTRAVKTEIIERSAGGVRVRVTTQRVETKGTAEPRSFYQPIEIALKQFGQGYFVDGAWWK